MKAIKYSRGVLSKDGKKYTHPQPNLYSIGRLWDEFRECMEESLRPVGMTMDSCSTHPQWVSGETDIFDLTKLDKITFTITLVKYNRRETDGITTETKRGA